MKETTTRIIVLCTAALLASACTVVRIGEEEADSDDQYATWTKTGTGFQAAEFVEAVWESEILPLYEDEAVDYAVLFDALANDRDSALAEYGLTKQTGEPFTVFKVRGEATLVEYDDSSRNGVVRIDMSPADGTIDATLQVGPVIRGTAIRDSLEFIRFTDIGNQLQFADLANKLNERMRIDSVDPLDLASLPGSTLTFLGAFRLEADEPLDEVVITPVRITVQDQE